MSLLIERAQYHLSAHNMGQLPPDEGSEVAFAGRSNAGKSSALNALTRQNSLARVSKTPGRTQQLVFFQVTPDAHLVDLPGYGYAKVALGKRKQWIKMIENYIRKRENLVNLFVLIDSRHSPQEIDISFINQLGEWKIPFAIVFTKADKSTQKEVAASVKAFLYALGAHWSELPPYFVSSAVKYRGRKEILAFIDEANKSVEFK